jgi:hypothetical protein
MLFQKFTSQTSKLIILHDLLFLQVKADVYRSSFDTENDRRIFVDEFNKIKSSILSSAKYLIDEDKEELESIVNILDYDIDVITRFVKYSKINFTDLKNPIVTCVGCLEDQPNQQAHMDEGGCMYEYQ